MIRISPLTRPPGLRPAANLLAGIVVVIFLTAPCCFGQAETLDPPSGNIRMDFERHRMEMIEQQLTSRGINDPEILAAFKKVERHRFVPERMKKFAYEDRPLAIGEGQTISQPYIVAFMTRALELKKTDKVLEIGTGSGYQAAILAELCDRVYSIEIIESLGKTAKKTLSELGYDNIDVKIGDGFQGWAENAPFDAIIVTAAPSGVPETLKEQLAEGGRMIIPVGRGYDQDLVLLEKENQKLKKKKVLPVLFVPMVDEQGKPY